MAKTKIEWCDETVNFITGCVHGCNYCYAKGTAARNARMGVDRYLRAQEHTGDPFAPSFHFQVYEKEFTRLQRATRPRVVFIGSMSDIAQEAYWTGYNEPHDPPFTIASHDVQGHIRDFCERLPQHIFILLTKKLSNLLRTWPSNVWIGTSVATHMDARYRIPYLLSYLQHSIAKEDKPLTCGGVLISAEPLQGGPDPSLYIDPAWLDGCRINPAWIVIGSQKRPVLKPEQVPHVVENGQQLAAWGAANGVPVFTKDNLVRQAPNLKWPKEFPMAVALTKAKR